MKIGDDSSHSFQLEVFGDQGELLTSSGWFGSPGLFFRLDALDELKANYAPDVPPVYSISLRAGGSGQVVIDDVTFEFVPEPSSIGLAIASFLALFGAANCRRISTFTGNTDGRTTRNRLTLRLFCRA